MTLSCLTAQNAVGLYNPHTFLGADNIGIGGVGARFSCLATSADSRYLAALADDGSVQMYRMADKAAGGRVARSGHAD